MPPSASSQSERTPRQAEEPHRRRLWLSTRGTTTGEDRTARSSSSHPGPTTPWPIFPGTNQAPASPRRPPQRIRASCLKAQVTATGTVLAPNTGHADDHQTQHPCRHTPGSCQSSSHHGWLTSRSFPIPRIWEPTGRGRSAGSRHLHGRMRRPSGRVTSVPGHQLRRGMSGDLGSVYLPDTLLDERTGHAGAAEKAVSRVEEARAQDRRGPPRPGAPARSAPTASARVVDAFVVEDLPMPEYRGDCGMGGTLL